MACRRSPLLLLLLGAAAAARCAEIAPSDCTGAIDKGGCGAVISAAVATCSERGGGVVRLAAGVFRFGTGALMHAWNVTAAGNDVRHYVTVNGAANVALVGTLGADGAAHATFLVLAGITNFITLEHTRGFTLANLVLDMDRPNYSFGQLIGCPAGADGCDFRVNTTEYPFAAFHDPVPEALLEVTSLHSFDPSTWREGPDGATREVYGGGKIASVTSEEDDEGYGVGGGGVQLVRAPGMESGMAVVRVRAMSSSSVRVLNSTAPGEGYHYVLRHRDGHLGRELGRGDHQIAGVNNSGLLQENLTSYLAPSMFNVVADTQQTLRNVHLRRHDGTTGGAWNSSSTGIRRPKSASVDCLGTPDGRGAVLIEDCSCDGQGDDGYVSSRTTLALPLRTGPSLLTPPLAVPPNNAERRFHVQPDPGDRTRPAQRTPLVVARPAEPTGGQLHRVLPRRRRPRAGRPRRGLQPQLVRQALLHQGRRAGEPQHGCRLRGAVAAVDRGVRPRRACRRPALLADHPALHVLQQPRARAAALHLQRARGGRAH